MILLPDNENTTRYIVEMQRSEVASLENSVEIYRGLHAKYEALLADAQRRLAKSEDNEMGRWRE